MTDTTIDPFLWELVPYTRGTGIEIGLRQTFPHFRKTDPAIIKGQSLDFVYCPDLQKPGDVKDWWPLIKHGGYLVLIGEPCGHEIKHWDMVRCEDRPGGQFQVFKRKATGENVLCLQARPKKSCAVVRYGAFGDAIQASSILPHLKAEGYHITFYGHQTTHEVLKHDPHINAWYVQDRDQIPNELLLEFWMHEQPKYDRWINLSGSVEETLLPGEGQSAFYWPKEARHEIANKNYLEMTHRIAEVPLPPKAMFYATAEEKAWARKQRAKAPGAVIVYSMSGSGINKVWPHMDALIARIMRDSDKATVVLMGAESDAPLQGPWENEARVWKRAGVWSIREAMAFAHQADLVVGSETGLLNAVGLHEVPKIVFLSHSSGENLCKFWRNTTALIPPETVSCYPCHRLITKWSHCHRDEETGVALCQAKIDIDTAWLAVQDVFHVKQQQKLVVAA